MEDKQHAELLKVEEFPIDKKMDKLVMLLKDRPWVLIDDIFVGETKKRGVITCFMALLELLKIGKILARQDQDKKEIRIYLNPENKNLDYKSLIKQQEEQENGKQPNPAGK